MGFAPFGKVVYGMDVIDAFTPDMAKRPGAECAPDIRRKLFEEGNAYLDRQFPLLDKLLRCEPVPRAN